MLLFQMRECAMFKNKKCIGSKYECFAVFKCKKCVLYVFLNINVTVLYLCIMITGQPIPLFSKTTFSITIFSLTYQIQKESPRGFVPEALAQVFSCKFLRTPLLTEHLWWPLLPLLTELHDAKVSIFKFSNKEKILIIDCS